MPPRRNLNIGRTVQFTPYLDWEEMPKVMNDGVVQPKYTDILLNTRYEVLTPDNKILDKLGELSKGKITLTSQRWRALIKYLCDTIIIGWSDNDPDLISEQGIDALGDWAGEDKKEHFELLVEEEELVDRFFDEYHKLYRYTEKKTEEESDNS